MPKENKTEVMQKLTSLFFHVEQVFPQCRGLISCLGTPQIASTDRYWVYPSAFSNRAFNHPMVKCARKKLKQKLKLIYLNAFHINLKKKNKMKQKTDHIESIKEFPIKFKLAKAIKYLTKKIKVKNQKTRCHVQPIQLNRN
uniref:Uncharacterized protein n=1 Tax=Gossypium raimondii TaxID=29730 RepID=A0A0D2VF82_GOSRA|nr:hypothetical protein B456_013G176300 [Gossypium raimondii]